jgi:hypothetical protein
LAVCLDGIAAGADCNRAARARVWLAAASVGEELVEVIVVGYPGLGGIGETAWAEFVVVPVNLASIFSLRT